MAVTVLLGQQLQKTVDELNAKLQTQDVQIADGKKQIADLQTRLVELQQAPPPTVATPVPASPPVVTPVASGDDGLNWPLLGGLLLLSGALVGLLLHRRRQQRGDQVALRRQSGRIQRPEDDRRAVHRLPDEQVRRRHASAVILHS